MFAASRFVLVVGAVAMGAILAGCSDVGDPRPQLLVVVDTDLPTIAQAFDDPTISRESAIDAVRVDVYPGIHERAIDRRFFPAPDAENWPLSFGVASDDLAGTRSLLLRVRLFQGRFATAGTADGEATVDPLPTVAVDRLIEVTTPSSGVQVVRVVVSGDCRGDPVAFSDPPTTCIDDLHRDRPPGEGVEIGTDLTLPPSRVGTWPSARQVDCANAPPHDDAVCIPGGFFVLGDTRFVAVEEQGIMDSVPLRSVLLLPFFMDRTEMTLERLEHLVARGYDGPMPAPHDPAAGDAAFCTYRPDFSADPRLPVNCLTHAAAAELCVAAGGLLPTEAQWEYAARGRGRGFLFPWGDDFPSCCRASLSRLGPPETPNDCPGSGIEPVGSHQGDAQCDGLGDVSHDGLLDLGGSVVEPVRDDFAGLDAPCWDPPNATGILVDPMCDGGALNAATRGGFWNGGRGLAAAPWRSAYGGGAGSGVRCVYPAEPALP